MSLIICSWRSFRFLVPSLRRDAKLNKMVNLLRTQVSIASNISSNEVRDDRNHHRTASVLITRWRVPSLRIGIIAVCIRLTQLTMPKDQSACNQVKTKISQRSITIGTIKTRSLWSPPDGKAQAPVSSENQAFLWCRASSQTITGLNTLRGRNHGWTPQLCSNLVMIRDQARRMLVSLKCRVRSSRAAFFSSRKPRGTIGQHASTLFGSKTSTISCMSAKRKVRKLISTNMRGNLTPSQK
jgi:hypothetical protein